MKMRKLVAIVTAVMMLCCIIPFSAAAEGNSATIDFTDKANRVSYSTEQQVWAQNGITVTNDKAASTSNVGDYGGEGYPVRFYKSSAVTVAYKGMTQIVFNCDDYKATYATDLAASITDGSVSVDGTVVTVTLAAPADTLVIAELAAQVRVDSITVYGEGGGETPDTPVDPEPDEPDTPAIPDGPELTIADAIALGQTFEHNPFSETKYYVTGVITEVYNTMWGNMYITDGEGNTLTIYGTYSADGETRYDAMEYAPVAGDTVVLYGIIGQYNGNSQMKNGWIIGVIGGDTPVDPEPDQPDEPDEPDTPVVPEDSAVLDFSTLDNRVSVSTSQQVWKQNGIIFTNDKGASTSNVNEKYFNPVRCYKSSTVTIEYPGMTKIVIDSVTYDDNDYAIGWTDSFSADATATVVDGDVTIVLAQPADVFVWEQLTSQSRAYTITVYTGDDGETPELPPVEPSDDPEPDTELTIADAIALGLSKAHNAYTEGMYYVTGVITEVYNTQWGNMYITDDEGNTLLIYGTYNEDGTIRYDAMENAPVAGDTVTLYGVIGQYNGTAQMKNGWLVSSIPGEGGGSVVPPVDPDPDVPPVDPPISDEIDTTIPYLFGMVQENVSTEDVYFLAGGMAQTYYLATTTDADAAILVYLEETDGGYFLYTMDGESKLYINMVLSDDGAHVNGAYESAPSTVYNYDWELYTLVAEVNGDIYAFGTRNDRNYTTMGPVKVSYDGFHADLYWFEDETDCEHVYETEVIDATCGADGATIYVCTLCGDSYEETIPATGEHAYDDEYDAECNACGATREVPERPVETDADFVVATVEGSAGATVQVTVSAVNNPGIVSTKVKVSFDTSVLKFVGYTEGNFSLGGYSTSDPEVANDNGYFIVNWCDVIHPDSTADLLATLSFEILEGTPAGFYDITIEFSCPDDVFNANDDTVWFNAVNGGVNVTDYLPGDADGNGKLNNRDLGLLQQYLNDADMSGKTFNEAAVDMDGNGKLNNRDLGALQKLLNQ